jgi:hypothetical protein
MFTANRLRERRRLIKAEDSFAIVDEQIEAGKEVLTPDLPPTCPVPPRTIAAKF